MTRLLFWAAICGGIALPVLFTAIAVAVIDRDRTGFWLFTAATLLATVGTLSAVILLIERKG